MTFYLLSLIYQDLIQYTKSELVCVRVGRANVVDPSPPPNVVPITTKRFAYVVLLTNAPSHFTYPAGALVFANSITVPTGVDNPRDGSEETKPAGVIAFVVSVPDATSAFVANSTIPDTVEDAAVR
jgi:hypothetical protein